MNKKKIDFLDDWISINFFCNPSSADEVLLNVWFFLKKNKEDDNSWFFIRYNTPSYHLRVRLKKDSCFGSENMKELLDDLLKNSLIWKTQIDTYCPENYKFRLLGVKTSEVLFCLYSQASLHVLNEIDNELEKIIYCFRIVQNLIYIAFNKRIDFMLNYLENFEDYFNDKYFYNYKLRKEVNKKYMLFNKANSEAKMPLKFNKIESKTNKILEVIKDISIENEKRAVFDFVNSHIHLIVNRTMSNHQKIYEALIYKFLIKYYKEEKYKRLI